MGRNVIFAIALRGGGAVFGLGYVWLLVRILDNADLGVVLYSLALSGLISALSGAGWVQLILRDGADRRALLPLLHRARIASFRMAVLAGVIVAPLQSWAMAGMTILISILAVQGVILAAGHRAQGRMIRGVGGQGGARMAVCFTLTAGAGLWGEIGAQGVLWLHLVGLGVVWGWLWIPSRAGVPDIADLWAQRFGQGGQILLAQADVLVIGWMISPREAAMYLVVRRLVGVLAMVFDAVRAGVVRPLAAAIKQDPRGTNVAKITAKINAMFLWIGAAMGGGMILCAPYILPLFGVTEARFVLTALTIGAMTPAICGATGLIMAMGGLERVRAKLIWAMVPVGFLALVFGAQYGIAGLAVAQAGAMMSVGVIGAWHVWRKFRVLPGGFRGRFGPRDIDRL